MRAISSGTVDKSLPLKFAVFRHWRQENPSGNETKPLPSARRLTRFSQSETSGNEVNLFEEMFSFVSIGNSSVSLKLSDAKELFEMSNTCNAVRALMSESNSAPYKELEAAWSSFNGRLFRRRGGRFDILLLEIFKVLRFDRSTMLFGRLDNLLFCRSRLSRFTSCAIDSGSSRVSSLFASCSSRKLGSWTNMSKTEFPIMLRDWHL